MEPAVDVVPGDGVGLGDEVAPVEDGRSARAGEPAGDAEPAEVAAAAGDRASNDDAEPSSPEEPDGAVGTDGDAETPAPSDGAGSDAADEARALPELDDPETLRAALEAILIVVDEPVSEVVLAQVLERPTAVVAAAVRELAESYTQQRRGFELRQAAGGWRIYTRDDFAPYVERFVLDGQQVRLTQAALETLAVVAYKQPVSRSRVSAIRGVNCDGVVRTLLTRGLIEECGAEPESGAYLYRTTTLFLERMGINSTDELPDLAPFLPDELPEEAS
ncbi:SMC-Scp complex subunit ScpB [Actinocatenispora comari]